MTKDTKPERPPLKTKTWDRQPTDNLPRRVVQAAGKPPKPEPPQPPPQKPPKVTKE